MERVFNIKFSLWVAIALIQVQGYEGCLEKERVALLELKAFITLQNASSWIDDKTSNCCDWERVKCNATTGRVIELSLRNVYSGVLFLNLSLFHPFEELQVLNLSFNMFSGWYENKGLVNLKNLKALDISFNQINGSLSSYGICELKNLIELNARENKFSGDLPRCLSNLTNLKVLDLSSNQFSGNLPSFIASITSLEYLSLYDNNFEGLFSFCSLDNLSKLEIFTLSTKNNLFQLQSASCLPTYQLKVLNLRNCNLHGAIPSFLLYQHNLRFIDLSHNKLVGTFPTWLLHNNTKLEVMYLKNNSIQGILQLPSSKHDLLQLDVSYNNFSGHLSKNMGIILPKLVYLSILENGFEGNIPSSMGEMNKLEILDLSSNSFSGELPSHFVIGCFSLKFLKVSNNNFHGEIFPKYMNLSRLHWLYLENNHFNGKLGDGLLKAANLRGLYISNNKISGQIPDWIGNFSGLEVLLMSKNLLEGNIPVQISNLKRLFILDISENRFYGPLASSLNLSSISLLYMQKNAFNGSIPSSLFESSKLSILDLSDNEFSGNIPHVPSNGSNLYMSILLLGGNHLQGHIPDQLCVLRSVNIMDLSRNRLNGSIPSCFTNMLLWVVKEDIEYDYKSTLTFALYDSEIWSSIYSIKLSAYYNSTLQLGILFEEIYTVSDHRYEVDFTTKNRYDTYKGNILYYMSGLDLSSNNLTGDIPSEIGDLQGIRALNLSNNFLSGSIPNSFSNLTKIESLDLSRNKLSGQIPPQLNKLNYVGIFNVSYNNLSGSTPDSQQFGSFDESSYIGNPYLCGAPINKSCTNDPIEQPLSPSTKEEKDELVIDMLAFFWSFAASYVTVILGLLVILWINPYWRRIWFYFIDVCIDLCFYWFLKYVFSK